MEQFSLLHVLIKPDTIFLEHEMNKLSGLEILNCQEVKSDL
ncbi:hypothetical protein MgSA37_03077 [Mucilaginibacter gotjawali]|uniref:Uncharacterized protein n=2 Tax=Mucilaginibacter gotjawali TaxID=1550579 RepID=A0A839SP39_9SPHI|nr:hypothetical protein [Mucilaginibacter gotjawali]BAU54898.1 hypothetical protein MgSA37_03077 [Mucilaginibacter gotjawali]